MASGESPESLLKVHFDPELEERLFILGDDEHYGTARWYRDLLSDAPAPMANVGDETLLAFVDEASALEALESFDASFGGFRPIRTTFEEAREIAKQEDLEGLAILRGPEDVQFHYVK